jgi:tetratricopeptide (TPR) repeat protein
MNRTLRYATRILFLLYFPIAAYAQHEPQTNSTTLQQALDLFEKGLYSEASAKFDRALSENSGEVQDEELAAYFYARAQSRLDSSRTDQLTDGYVRDYPKSRYASVLLKNVADQHKERGELDQAIARMQEAAKYPQSSNKKAELYYTTAETAAENGQNDLARDTFLELSDNFLSSDWSPKALYARGRLFLADEQYEDASGAFELLRERHPFDSMTRRIGTALGESYYQQRRYNEAIEALERALTILDEENRSKAVFLIAESYNALNDYQNATRYYRMYINRSDDADQERIAHYGLGWVYHKQEIYHWAADAFGRAAVGDDTVARKGLYYQAVNNKLAGRYQQALDAFREFGQRFQEGEFFEQAYYEWAMAAFEIGFYGEAIEALLPLARDLENLENPGQTLTFLGEVYFANAEYTRALETFQLAEDLTDIDDSLKRQARFQKAWIQYSNQAFRQAQPEFEAVYSQWPDSDLGKEALFWSADAHFQYQNYGPASSQYARFIRAAPDHELIGAAKYALGWAYFKMGDYENATGPLIDFLDNYEPPSIALFPFDTDTKLRIGDAFYAQGAYGDALEYYNDTIGAEPGGDYAMFQVANSYYRMNRNFEAVTQFRRMLRIYPFSSLREQAQYNIAYIYLNTGNYDQAVTEFNTVIERFPGTEWAARAQYNIGDSYYNAGEYDRAIEEYTRVLEGYPGSSYILEAINGIEFAQLSAGESDSSTDVLESFLDENPTSETADRLRFRQAENTLQSGDYEAAVSDFRQYLRITNNQSMMPEAYFNLADAYQRMNQPDDAAEAYRTIVNEFPDSDRLAPALAELGQILLEREEYSEARTVFEELADTDQRFRQEANLGIGRAALGLGDTGSARQFFERVLAINESNDAARAGLGKVLLADGRTDEARRLFSMVANENNTAVGAEAQYLLAMSYQDGGNFEQALEEYSKVQVLFEAYDTWVAEAQYKTAEIYIREGRRGDALSLLRSIVENYPGTTGAEKAQQLLNQNQ